MVRLKDGLQQFENALRRFQFQNGAIKRKILVSITDALVKFQFQNGAIKSTEN